MDRSLQTDNTTRISTLTLTPTCAMPCKSRPSATVDGSSGKTGIRSWETTSLVSLSIASHGVHLIPSVAQDNPHANDAHSLQRALDILSAGGSLTEACLLLEAALASGTAEAQAAQLSAEQGSASMLAGGEAAVWTLLGQTQAMDEKETAAVRALEEGRKRFEAQQGRAAEANRTFGEGLVVRLPVVSHTSELTYPAVIGHLIHQRIVRLFGAPSTAPIPRASASLLCRTRPVFGHRRRHPRSRDERYPQPMASEPATYRIVSSASARSDYGGCRRCRRTSRSRCALLPDGRV